jgi:two-component system sensor kinase FixL
MKDLELADYRDLVQSLKYCVLIHDAATYEILWANHAACALLGWTVDELKPLKAPDMSKNAQQYSRELGHRWLHGAVEHGVSATEWCYRSKRGEEVLTEAIAIRVDLPSRPVIMVQFRDIEEEKAVRRDLFRTEGRLRAFLASLAEGIVVLDDDGRVIFASESATKQLGPTCTGPTSRSTALTGPYRPRRAAIASPNRAMRPAGTRSPASTSTSRAISEAICCSSTTSPTGCWKRRSTAGTPSA